VQDGTIACLLLDVEVCCISPSLLRTANVFADLQISISAISPQLAPAVADDEILRAILTLQPTESNNGVVSVAITSSGGAKILANRLLANECSLSLERLKTGFASSDDDVRRTSTQKRFEVSRGGDSMCAVSLDAEWRNFLGGKLLVGAAVFEVIEGRLEWKRLVSGDRTWLAGLSTILLKHAAHFAGEIIDREVHVTAIAGVVHLAELRGHLVGARQELLKRELRGGLLSDVSIRSLKQVNSSMRPAAAARELIGYG
jgi:hypothetical protein